MELYGAMLFQTLPTNPHDYLLSMELVFVKTQVLTAQHIDVCGDFLVKYKSAHCW